MPNFLKDLRYAFRLMNKNRLFTLIAVSSLGFGIGASVLIFGAVEAVLLRPLPFSRPDRLLMIWETHPQVPNLELSLADFFDFRAQSDVFEGLAGYSYKGLEISVLQTREQAVHLAASDVSEDLLPVLGITPMLGRNFLAAEEKPGNDHEVILSHRLWRERFGADKAIIGRTITLDNEGFTVIGVLPADQQYPQWADILFPLPHAGDLTVRAHHTLETVGRLKPNISASAATSELLAISQRLKQQYPLTNKSITITTKTLSEYLVGNTRPTLLLLLAAVGFVLLITCINVSGLVLARTIARRKESALRMALGAGSGRLFRQFLTENFTIAAIGGILGLGLATALIPLVRSWLVGRLPRIDNIEMNGVVLLFAAGITWLTGLLLGFVPALQGRSLGVYSTLKEGARDSGPSSQSLVRKMLVVGQVALAVMVLASTGLVLRSLQRLLRGDLGFQAEHAVVMKLKLPQYSYSRQEQIDGFFRELLGRLKANPQIQEVGSSNIFPLNDDPDIQSRFLLEGTQPDPGNFPVARVREISPGYFAALKIPLITGRMFHEDDMEQPRVIINQSLARRYFSGQNPIGRKIVLGVLEPKPVSYEVVGIVGDVRDVALKEPSTPGIYLPGFWVWGTVIARTTSAPDLVAQILRREVKSIDKNQAVDDIQTMETLVSNSVAPERISAQLMTVFSIAALFLAAMGIYGIMAYLVANRTREIGIRMALGAQRGDVLRMIFNSGMLLIAAGLGLGLTGSVIAGRALSGILYGIKGADPFTLIGVAVVLATVAGAAIYFPARRAARIDPLRALRFE
jgi:putative ABC transport system permease protein